MNPDRPALLSPHRLPWLLAWLAVAAAGLALRGGALESRPLHADEGVQGMIFADLLENGQYRYDPHHYHGPSLYYLTLPVAWLRGQSTATQLDELTLRLVPLLFSLLLAAAPLLLRRELGPCGTLAACGFLLLSPGINFFSADYIQEMLLVAGFAWFTAALWRFRQQPGWGMASLMGAAAGLMLASKENALAHILLALLALGSVTGFRRTGQAPAGHNRQPLWRVAGIAVLAALLVAVPLFSSFGRHPGGLLDAVRGLYAFQPVSGHEKPWYYYLALLAGADRPSFRLAGEGWLLAGAILGGVLLALPAGRDPRVACGRYHALMALALILIISAIPYKTPWLVLGSLYLLAITAGSGAGLAWSRWRRPAGRALLALGLLFAWSGLARETVWATRRFPDDPRNPYAYVQTGWDLVELTNRVRRVAGDPSQPVIKVIAEEYWPVPWYLRGIGQAGYWNSLPDDPYAPVMIVGTELAGGLDPRRMEDYVVEFRGLRPGRLLLLYIRRDLWERQFGGNGP